MEMVQRLNGLHYKKSEDYQKKSPFSSDVLQKSANILKIQFYYNSNCEFFQTSSKLSAFFLDGPITYRSSTGLLNNFHNFLLFFQRTEISQLIVLSIFFLRITKSSSFNTIWHHYILIPTIRSLQKVVYLDVYYNPLQSFLSFMKHPVSFH